MFKMSERTHKQCDYFNSQELLTLECILNQDYAYKAQNSA